VDEGFSQAGLKAIAIAIVLMVLGPVLTHVTARAIRTREHGTWMVRKDEEVEEL